MPSRRSQSGQVLLLALLLAAVGAFLLLAVFSSGQVLATRDRLVGAADAAALSAATWRARVLNTIAYTNRAIVAQEVALAQSVTLASWARHFDSLAGNAEALAALHPAAAALLASISSVAEAGREAAEHASSLEQRWRADESLGDKVLLARSQEWLLRSADVFALGALANEVVRATDSRFFAFALSDGGDFSRFTARQETPEARGRLREVILASLDGYSARPRSSDLRVLLPSSCVGGSSDLNRWTLWLRRRGGTALHDTLETWSAIDTTSLHDWRRRGFLWFGSCSDRETLALGWGSAGGELSFKGGQGDAARVNPGATGLARAAGEPSIAGLAGLPRVHDLSAAAAGGEAISRLAVLARVERRALATVDRLGVAAGRMRVADGSAAEHLWAISAAEVFFSAPPEPGLAPQRPSLFSPFWQARLAKPSASEHAAARAYVR